MNNNAIAINKLALGGRHTCAESLIYACMQTSQQIDAMQLCVEREIR